MACEKADLPIESGMGPTPTLPAPKKSMLPTVKIAPAPRLACGRQADAAPGMTVNAFARGLAHPRWLYVLPNGDVLVAETNAPPQARGREGLQAAGS